MIWARMSRGCSMERLGSISRSRRAPSRAAALRRSIRRRGMNLPTLVFPTPWPERPMRWRAAAAEGGLPARITSSALPMSIPSSREEVATTQGSFPSARPCSTALRSSFERLPWWARERGRPAAWLIR
jgi:hypothetical protein